MKIIRNMRMRRSHVDRADQRMRAFNELMENGQITRAEHSVLRPIVDLCRQAVTDALTDQAAGRSGFEVQDDYDERVNEQLRHILTMVEKEFVSANAGGAARAHVEAFKPIIRSALEQNYGHGLPSTDDLTDC